MKLFFLLLLPLVIVSGCGNNAGEHLPEFNAGQPAMVFVKGGKFNMGGTINADEQPVHEVVVNNFSMCAHEVTVGEFRQFIKNSGYKTDADKKGLSYVFDGKFHTKEGVNWECSPHGTLRQPNQHRYPVVHVSWNDAVAYCRWLSAKTHKSFRLPTEAEWEYAARGGSVQKPYTYSGGDSLGLVAWYEDNSNWTDHPVQKKLTNSLGIYDMSGNVWEWCQDWYGETYYRNSPKQAPTGPDSGMYRVLRGGSWNYGAIRSRIPCRDGTGVTDTGYYNVGFRVVCDE
jgi:sulfatase modifying factor 1